MRTLILLALSLPVFGQIPEYVKVGDLSCGMARPKGTSNVQVWCYKLGNVLVHNSLNVIPASGGSLVVSYNYPNPTIIDPLHPTYDIVTWTFTWSGSIMTYECSGNGSKIKSGRLF